MLQSPHAYRRYYWIPLSLALVVILLYIRTIGYGFVNYDDALFVLDDSHVTGGLTPANVKWALTTTYLHWQPLTWLSYQLDASLAGESPEMNHATNVALHALTAVILFFALWRLTGSVWPSAIAVLIFALHPLRVESVAWVSSRKDVMSGLFTAASLLLYARYVQHPRLHTYFVFLIAFAAALMSKGLSVTLPILFLLLDYWPLNRVQTTQFGATLRAWGGLLVEKLPLFAMSLGVGLMTVYTQHKGGVFTSAEVLTYSDRISNATVAYAVYLRQFVWPTNLAVFYPHPRGTLSVWQIALSAALLISISAMAWRFRKSHGWIAVGWLWFLISTLPVSGLFQAGAHPHADRYTYIALIGPTMAVVWTAQRIWANQPRSRRPIAAATIVAVGAITVLSWLQIAVWRDSFTLASHAISAGGPSGPMLNNLGYAHASIGEYEQAVECYVRALEVDPNAHNVPMNLAAAYLHLDRPRDALPVLTWVLQNDPSNTDAMINMAVANMAIGDPVRARANCRDVLAIDPDHQQAQDVLVWIDQVTGTREQAN